MKKRYFWLAAIFLSCFVLAGDETSTPMELFKVFRQAVIDNDSAKLLEITGEKLLTNIQNNSTIPADLRKDILFVEAAYEDVDIRMTTPDKAVVYAFVKQNGQLRRLEISMSNNQNNVRKIISLNNLPHYPEPAVKKLISMCQNQQKKQFLNILTPELAKEITDIPGALQIKDEIKFKSGKISGSNAVYALDAAGIKGNIQLVRNGYFWKISSIAPIFIAESPAAVIKNFCSKLAVPELDPESLKDFFTEKYFNQVKEILAKQEDAAKLLPLLTAFKSVAGQRPAGNAIILDVAIDSEQIAGTLEFKMLFEKDKWVIAGSADNTDLVYNKSDAPAAVMEKFISAWLKEANQEQVKELVTPQMLTSLTEKEGDPEVAADILNSEIKRASAIVTLNLTAGKNPGKWEYSLTLQKGKWLISSRKELPKEEAAEPVDETAAK